MSQQPADRRHRAERWQRFGAAAGIVAALALIVDLVTLASSPPIDAAAPDVAAHVASNSLTLVMSYLGAVTSVLLLPFLASLRTFVHRESGEAEWQWSITLLSGAVAVSMLLVGSALRGAAADLASRHADPAAVSAVFGAAKVVLTFVLLPIAAIVLSNARTIAQSRTPVRWLVRFGREIGLVSLLASLAIFFRGSDWLGPGEPAVAAAAFLLSLWLVATSVTILQGESVAASH